MYVHEINSLLWCLWRNLAITVKFNLCVLKLFCFWSENKKSKKDEYFKAYLTEDEVALGLSSGSMLMVSLYHPN